MVMVIFSALVRSHQSTSPVARGLQVHRYFLQMAGEGRRDGGMAGMAN